MKDRIVELVRVRAGRLKANPANWRTHPKAQREALQGLLEEIGYADALIARREGEDLVLLDGHLRASLDPAQLVPVLVLDLDEEEADKLLATLDPLASLAGADSTALSDLLSRVETSSLAVRDLLEGLWRGLAPGPGPTESDLEEIPEPARARTHPGDLWVLGEHRLICGDARSGADISRLTAGDRADLFLTDPPWGVEYVGKTRRALRLEGDDPKGLRALLEGSFQAAAGVLSPGAGVYVFAPAGPNLGVFLDAFTGHFRLRQILCWVKDQATLGHCDYHHRAELICQGYAPGGGRRGRGARGWYGGDDQTSVLEFDRPRQSPDHPTAKPVALIARLVSNSSRPGQILLDPFAGSGSVLAAGITLGRRAFLAELSPAYCDVILARYESLTGKAAKRERKSA